MEHLGVHFSDQIMITYNLMHFASLEQEEMLLMT